MITRRAFIQIVAAAAGTVRLKADATYDVGSVRLQPDLRATALQPDQRAGRPRGSEFVFARLRYESGDWDYNPKVAANVLDSLMQYTSIPVYKEEVAISASSRCLH